MVAGMGGLTYGVIEVGDWLATKHGMIDTLLAMVESGEMAGERGRI